EKRLIADSRSRAQDGVTETERHALADEDASRFGRHDVPHECQHVVLTGFLELALELGIGVEVILDGALRRARHEHEALGAGFEGFLDGILNERLIDYWQHLLRRRLGSRKE